MAVLALLLAQQPARAESGSQICWSLGTFDQAVYYAEAVNREDRSAGFRSLMEISGVEFAETHCVWNLTQIERQLLFQRWRRDELEVIDTTFMSDLDY